MGISVRPVTAKNLFTVEVLGDISSVEQNFSRGIALPGNNPR
jgi:hypothetical protein